MNRLGSWATVAVAGFIVVGLPASYGQSGSASLSASPTLLERSPFLPPGWTPPEDRRQAVQAKQTVAGYEFRGIYQIGGEYRFLVSEPRSRSGSWVRVGESRDNFEVRRYDASSDTLVLFFNNKEQRIQMAEMESNPTPIPVSGQVQSNNRETKPEQTRPARRTIRPASRSTEPGSQDDRSAPPPPAWLQKLREEAAERRAQARGSVLPPSGLSASGDPTGFTPPPPPDGVPPTPPPNISEIDIPPPPDSLPPAPPAEIQEQILQSISRRARPGN